MHCAGNFLIKLCNGKEIIRYFHGSCGLENTKTKAHKHSQLALNILSKYYVGAIEMKDNILIK